MCSHMKSELLLCSNLLLVFDLDYKVLFHFKYLLASFTACLCCVWSSVSDNPHLTWNGAHPSNWWQIKSQWREAPFPVRAGEVTLGSVVRQRWWWQWVTAGGCSERLKIFILLNMEYFFVFIATSWSLVVSKMQGVKYDFETRTGKLLSSNIFGLNLFW